MKHSNRLLRGLVAIALVGGLALTGCGSKDNTAENTESTSTTAAKPAAVKIGTLATQDALPLWVAQDKGYFKDQGLDKVEIVTFQSAQEEAAAFASGAVQGLMTDLIVSANMQASGTPVYVSTVMLGATTDQGRFAVVAAPKSGIHSMSQLKGVPVGVGSATVTELVLDKLAEEAGLSAGDVKKAEVKKVPVRFQLLMSGKLKAASLPEPFVTLATQTGASIPEGGDDTKAKQNISQSVLTFNRKFYETPEGKASVNAVLSAWDSAVQDINTNPNDYRGTLVDKARLPQPLAKSYAVSTYPMAAQPTDEMVQMVLDWMTEKGYLKTQVTPEDLLQSK